MLRRGLLFLILLACVGEAVVRFDERTLFLRSSRVEDIGNDYKERPETWLARTSPRNPASLRIMLLGDSKLYGYGVRPESRVTTQVAARLERGLGRSNYLFDLTRPGNNTSQNRQAFESYVDSFMPSVVILAYDHNDVYGDQSRSQSRAIDETRLDVPSQEATTTTKDRVAATVATIRDMLGRSHMLSFVLVKLNMELKLAGVVIPGTEFEHLLNRSHASDYPGWIESQKHLAAIARICHDRGIALIVYLVPDLEMLPRYALFNGVDQSIAKYFVEIGATFVNGVEPFRAQAGRDFALSRYDGHPNEAAHLVMSSQLCAAVIATADPARGSQAGRLCSNDAPGRNTIRSPAVRTASSPDPPL
jgi:hypothetical protein